MKKYWFIILFAVAFMPVFAQKAVQADELFNKGNYGSARGFYESLHKADPANELYTYRLARCEQELGRIDKAIQLFEACGDKYSAKPFFLADVYFKAYRFAEAKAQYEKYIATIEDTDVRYEATNTGLRLADQAMRYFARLEDVAIIDTLTISAASINKYATLSEGSGTFEMLNGELSFVNGKGDRRVFVTTDAAHGTMLLCQQKRLLNEWADIDTLPETVNRFKQVAYPFLMSDGLTICFAAVAENGLGGWDLYKTKFNPSTGNYTTPELLNMPFNSLQNDYLYYVDDASNKGYFFSNRNCSSGQMVRYTFVPTLSPQVLKGETEEYMRSYAMLKVLRDQTHSAAQADSQEEPLTGGVGAALAEWNAQQPAWHIIINDSTIYTSLSQFHQDTARVVAEHYLAAVAEQEEKTLLLAAQRAEYMELEDPADKLAAQPDILATEQDLLALRLQVIALLKHLRQLENN